ncbi:MAG: pyrroline-5-carboxylate reductase [Planctomycetes bacterium]|nr:pyrroline-5-carboxylate reductase [Planctomycetota bacterium]
MSTIGFIGAGNMAEALIKGIIASGVYKPDNIIASDISPERLAELASRYDIGTTESNTEISAKADTLVLSVKPQVMVQVLEEIKTCLKPGAVAISIAAGITTNTLAKSLGDTVIVRVMPNTPALVGEGMSALFSANASKETMQKALELFSSVGEALVVETEEMIDAVTAVSGSGPAYYFLLMEEMIKAAENMHLPADIAEKLVLQTAKGASILAQKAAENAEKPAQLRKKVTSPGGTTEAALNVFANEDFSQMVKNALNAAQARSRELSG